MIPTTTTTTTIRPTTSSPITEQSREIQKLLTESQGYLQKGSSGVSGDQVVDWIKNLTLTLQNVRDKTALVLASQNQQRRVSSEIEIATEKPVETQRMITTSPHLNDLTTTTISTTTTTVKSSTSLARTSSTTESTTSTTTTTTTTTTVRVPSTIFSFLSTTTTTTPAPPAGLLQTLQNAVTNSAAPLAGFSAATLAYGAAALLPVWLPLALGKKKRRRRRRKKRSSFINEEELLLLMDSK